MNDIPIAIPINQSICRRCNKTFIRDPHAKQGSAKYYRCEQCLSIQAVIVDTVYICNIM